MKKKTKIILGVIAFFVVLSFFIDESDNQQNNATQKKETTVAENEKSEVPEESSTNQNNTINNPYEGRKGEIFDIILKRINDGEYTNTTISQIEINENAGTEIEDDYIVLIRGSFDMKNSKETGNKLLKMYADDLMSYLIKQDVSDIAESAVFWEDDYNNRTIKYAYEYRDNDFHIHDIAGE